MTVKISHIGVSSTPLVLALLALALLAACARSASAPAPATSATPRLDTERARTSYMVGLDMAKTMTPVNDEIDIDIVIAAIRDAHAGRKPALSDAEIAAVRARFGETLRRKQDLALHELARRNLVAANAFLARNAKAANVLTLKSGLQYQLLRSGSGATPGPADTVRANYLSTDLTGRKIESTYDTDHPATIALNRVFPGWAEGVQHMRVGGRARFWIPPSLAYGERGNANGIEPNALLVFDVELLEVAGKPGADLAHDRTHGE